MKQYKKLLHLQDTKKKTKPRGKSLSKIDQEIKELPTKESIEEYILQTYTIIQEYTSLKEEMTTIDPLLNASDQIKGYLRKQQELAIEYFAICKLDINLKYYTQSLQELKIEEEKLTECCAAEEIICSGSYVCKDCGAVSRDLITEASYNQIQETEVSGRFIYKRSNYFREWLRQIEGSENVAIPENLIENIKIELQKRQIKDTSNLKPSIVKRILKDLNYARYYENVQSIICKLANRPHLCIPIEITSKLKNMFEDIQIPYQLLKGERKNFFSYPYVLYKFCQILQLDHYLPLIQLLKNRDNLVRHDILWKKIILYLRQKTGKDIWIYYPSC